MYNLNTNEGYLIHLIACALKDETPKNKPQSVDFCKVLELAKSQNVANLTWYSVEKLSEKPSEQILHLWHQLYAKAVVKCATQQIELDILKQSLVNNGYDVLPLKGSVVRNYYPVPDMRTMTDIDLLVKTSDRESVRKIMAQNSYKMALEDDGQVDAFEKEPIMAIDIHYNLMADNHHFHQHFQNPWDSAVKTEENGVYKFEFEDMYVYNIGHYGKHMFGRGTGIRCIIDSYVLWNSCTDNQKQIITEKLKNSELLQFNNQLIKIGKIWFDNMEDDKTVDELQQFFMQTSTYGNQKNSVALNLIKDEGKDVSMFKYYLNRFFPSSDLLYTKYEIKHRCFLILPILWIMRLFSVFSHKQRLTDEVKGSSQIDKEVLEFNKTVYKKLGLK